jgi:hypothetical protein
VTADEPLDLPDAPLAARAAARRRAEVERVRNTLLDTERPLVTLRWLMAVTPPEVLAEALTDPAVRERMAEPFRQVGELLRGFTEVFASLAEHAQRAARSLGEALRDAGVLPEEPPADPRARALWLRRHRGTGPDRQMQHRPRPRRLG